MAESLSRGLAILKDPRQALQEFQQSKERDERIRASMHTLHIEAGLAAGGGQAEIVVTFPVKFVKKPFPSAMGELVGATTWDKTNLPTWEICVLAWRQDNSGRYVGAIFGVVARNVTLASRITFTVTGMAIVNPSST